MTMTKCSPEMTLLGGRSMHFLPVTFSLVGNHHHHHCWCSYCHHITIIIKVLSHLKNSASFLSAFTLLGLPAEVYTQVSHGQVSFIWQDFSSSHFQGTQFLSVVTFTPITAFVLVTTFLPIFHNLQVATELMMAFVCCRQDVEALVSIVV